MPSKNLDCSDIDERYNEYITNHNKNLKLYLVKYDFKEVFDNDFYPHLRSEL